MRAKILSIKEEVSSRHQGIFYFIFFKGQDGKSYRTCVSSKFGNYKRWQKLISRFYSSDNEIWLDGLVVRSGRLIDADSDFRELIAEGVS